MNQPNSIVSDKTDTTTAQTPVVEDKTLLYQTPAYLVRLVHQAEGLEQQINALLADVKQNNIQLDVLTRHTTEATATRMVEQRLADVVTQLEGNQEQFENLTSAIKWLRKLKGNEDQLNLLAKSVKHNNIQLDVLTRHASDATATQIVEHRLVEVLTWLESHQAQLEHITNTVKQFSQLESHEEQLKILAKSVKQSNIQLEMLIGHATEAVATQMIEKRLADLMAQLGAHQEQVEQIVEKRLADLMRQLEAHQAPQEHLADTVKLLSQLESHEEQLKILAKSVKQGNIQLDVLTRHTTEGIGTRMIEQRLTDVIGQLEGHEEQLEKIDNTIKLFTQLESHEQQLKTLNKTVKKLSRTQFKANTLHESQQTGMQDALSTWQELATRRNEVVEVDGQEEKQRLTDMRIQARREMAAELLPALDGVENAIESGRALLLRRQQEFAESEAELDAQIEGQNAQNAQIEAQIEAQIKSEEVSAESTLTEDNASESNPSFWSRLDYAFGGKLPEKPKEQIIYKTVKVKVPTQSDKPLAAWLDGLDLVRERFLSLLVHEEIQPIPALNQPFNPRLHVAVEAVERDDVPAGTVVKVVRKGYRQSERILRYAEVVVSKAVE